MGHAAVRLAVRRRGAAGSSAARVGRAQLQPPLWGNFFYTDNRALGPADYDTLTFTAPTQSGPATSGQPVTSYKRMRTAGVRAASDNYYTFASDYGDVTYYWHGVDLTITPG